MPDRAVVVLAGVAWVGAWVAAPAPRWAAAVVVSLAFGARRPWLLCVGVFLLAGGLATSARAGLEGLRAGPIDAEVTLLTDPERFGDQIRVEVRADGRHLEAWAGGSAGAEVADRDAGDRLRVRGRVEPFAAPDAWRRSRHLAGRLDMSGVRSWRAGGPIDRLANGYRGLLAQGAVSLDEEQRSLLAGLVLGDDRAQPPTLVDAFRGAGLTHLLAVSGQNVAFVLLVVEPLLRRLPLGGRVVSVLVVLALFGVVTRFEPSVLRATAMAGVAVASSALGRPAGGRRALALAVTALVLVDPLLVHSIGFTLSVAASFGIIVWSRPIADALPFAPGVARPVGVIAAAQLAVAPVLVVTFGALPTASLPANLLAGPAAGPAMVWGMTAGAVAGLVPAPLATVIHLPTQALLGWIEVVARLGAAAPLGGLEVPSLVAIGAGSLWWWVGPRPRPWSRIGPAVAVSGLLVPVAVALVAPVPARTPLTGAVLWRSGNDSVLVVRDEPRPVRLLAELRRARVRGLDLIAAEAPLSDDTLRALRDRFGPVPLLAAEGAAPRLPVGPTGSSVRVGSLSVHVRAAGRRPVLDVVPSGQAVRSPGALGARAPPLRRDPSGTRDGHPQPHAGFLLRPGSLLGLRRLRGHRRAAGEGGCRLPRRGRCEGRPRSRGHRVRGTRSGRARGGGPGGALRPAGVGGHLPGVGGGRVLSGRRRRRQRHQRLR